MGHGSGGLQGISAVGEKGPHIRVNRWAPTLRAGILLLVVEGAGNLHMGADLAGLDHEFPWGPLESLAAKGALSAGVWRVKTGLALVGAALWAGELRGEFFNIWHHKISPCSFAACVMMVSKRKFCIS